MIETDVLIVGAGPAGLATALALLRGAKEGKKPRVVVLDKGRSPGSHVLSGAIVDPSGLRDLLTEEELATMPCEAKVCRESFRCNFTSKLSLKIPWVPALMSSKGYPVVSLTKVVAWLCALAQKAGAEVYTGYAVTALVEKDGRIVGARTGEKGLDKDGRKKSNYLPSEEIRARVDDALAAVGMSEFTRHAPHLLSGGQKQRVAIAGVIAMAPECIVLDEATAMLDPVGRREVLSTIRRLNAERGMTVVLITHHMDEAEHADRVIVMNDGCLAMDGTPREVFARVEELRALGPAAPDTVELLYELRSRGIDIPLDAMTVEECADAICRAFSGEK